VCVVDGVDTSDSLTMRQTVGDGARLGIAWLLVLAGPIGWLGLAVIALSRSGQGEVLTVRLPHSEAAYGRWRGAKRQRGLGMGAVVVGFALVVLAQLFGTVDLPLAVVAVAVLVWGLGVVIYGSIRMGRQSIGVELDASRRWVTLRRVHPRFAALADQMADHDVV
jgi:hypothetical protein